MMAHLNAKCACSYRLSAPSGCGDDLGLSLRTCPAARVRTVANGGADVSQGSSSAQLHLMRWTISISTASKACISRCSSAWLSHPRLEY